MKDKPKKYEVLIASQWYRCRKAAVNPSGWLTYELRDGTTGLAPAKKWREVVAQKEDKP